MITPVVCLRRASGDACSPSSRSSLRSVQRTKPGEKASKKGDAAEDDFPRRGAVKTSTPLRRAAGVSSEANMWVGSGWESRTHRAAQAYQSLFSSHACAAGR